MEIENKPKYRYNIRKNDVSIRIKKICLTYQKYVNINTTIFRKVINGLVYKTVETATEVEKCFELYQNSFMKGKNRRNKEKLCFRV